MTALNAAHFKDEVAAYAFVEARVWPKGRICPHCGVVENSGALKGKSTRIGTYKCYSCRKPFTVKVGRKTIEAARAKIGEAVTLLEIARDEETDYKENMPESFANGEKGSKADEAIEKLEEVLEALESADGTLEEVVSA